MKVETARLLWFLALWLMLPWAMPIMDGSWVPAVRYVILAGAASLFALREGVAGPLPGLLLLFGGWALVTTGASWLLSRLIGRILALAPPKARAVLTLVPLMAGLAYSLLQAPYVTRFGRAAHGGLIEILS